MLLVQKYLETKSFGDLAKEHGVYASFSKSGHKWSLNYDQIEAKETDPLAQECRGLILSAKDGTSFLSQAIAINNRLNYDHVIPGKTKILAFPMKRFFNYGQGCAAQIDWNDPNLTVFEKLDGTLCIVYWDRFTNSWCVATRSVPEADLPLDNGLFTIRTLFEKALKEIANLSFDEYTSNLDKEITYCFELTTPYNRIVVNYPNNRITLIAARQVVYGLAAEASNAEEWIGLSEININNEWVASLNPLENEGVVVMNSSFDRIKAKNPSYVAYNKARDTLGSSERNCLELILSEKDDDVIPALPPDIVENLLKIKQKTKDMIHRYDEIYLEAKSDSDKHAPGNKKYFAQQIVTKPGLWTAPLFQMYDGKAVSMKDFIQKNRKDGTWSNSFLDKFLEISNKF
jgi:hypothetical protein